jgi:hypothetical protein
MTIWAILVLAFAGLLLVWLGCVSVQSLLQAHLLRSCRRASLAGLAGRSAALRGRVKVREVVRIAHIGDCLWHRETIRQRDSDGDWITQCKTTNLAAFSIAVGGEEVRVARDPTEVQGGGRKSVVEKAGFVDGFFGDRDEEVVDEWLPVLEEITVVGRLERRDAGWEIVPDGKAGLLLSAFYPDRAALQESVKGWLGIAGVVAGFVAIGYLYFWLSP